MSNVTSIFGPNSHITNREKTSCNPNTCPGIHDHSKSEWEVNIFGFGAKHTTEHVPDETCKQPEKKCVLIWWNWYVHLNFNLLKIKFFSSILLGLIK